MIAIYNLEPKYKNLALEKIRKYYIDLGKQVEDYFALNYNNYEKIYASSIFDFTDKSLITPDMICGGSGFDYTVKLPPEIEQVKPKINLGFTSRGCIRNCEFCLVPKMEGKIRATGDIYDLWDEKSKKITLYDNNILALPKHFETICRQLKKENIKVDLNQGIDIRLIRDNNAKMLSEIRSNDRIRVAWDFMDMEKMFLKKLPILTKYIKPVNINVYILVGFNTTFEQDYYRIQKCKELGLYPFAMDYNKKSSKLLKELCRWTNRYWFRHILFKDYLKARKNLYLLKNT